MPNRAAFRILAVFFVLPAAVIVGWGLAGLREGRIEAGAIALAPVYLAAAFGLWTLRRWGRTLALIIALTNLALGVMSILSGILNGTPTVGAALFAILNLAIAGALTRDWFGLPGEQR